MEAGVIHQLQDALRQEVGPLGGKVGQHGLHLGGRPGAERQRGITEGAGYSLYREQGVHEGRDSPFIGLGIEQEGGIVCISPVFQGRAFPVGGEGEFRLVLEEEKPCKDADEQHQERIAQAILDAGDGAEGQLRDSLPGGFHRVVSGQDEEGEYGENAKEREGDAFGEHHAQVGPYLQLDEAEHQKAHDGGEGAAENGRGRVPDGAFHGAFPVFSQGFFLPVPVHQDNAVIHGQHHLEHRCEHIGHHGDAGQQGVSSHIERHGKTGGQEEQHHFHHGGAHDQKNHEQHSHADGQDTGQVLGHEVVAVGKQGPEILHPVLECGQLLLHDIQSLFHDVLVREVTGHIRVDADMGNSQGAEDHQKAHQHKNHRPVFY